MLKKITLIFIAIILMMNIYIGVIYADEDTTEEVVLTENEEGELLEPVNEVRVVEANAKVIEASQPKKVVNGSIEDTVQTIKLEVSDGEFKGKEISTDYVLSYDVDGKILAYKLTAGNRVTIQITEDANGSISASIEDFQRVWYVIIAFILLLAAIIVIGGKHGINVAVSLVITISSLYFVLIKLIFAGANVIFASLFTSLIITGLTFVFTVGVNKKSLTGMVSSFLGTLAAGILVMVFGYFSKLSGATEEAIQISLNLNTLEFNFRDLIFVSIVISSIGACMDIATAIIEELEENKNKDQDFDWKELYKRGMQVGQRVLGTMSNTLILVYIGGLIKLILMYKACNIRMLYIMSKEAFAEQMISAIAGTIGVVCTAPLTSLAYAFINRKKTIYKTVSENKIEGKRSLKI